MIIIERIKKIIAQKEMSETAFSKLIGVSQRTLNNYMNGRVPSLEVIDALLSAFPEVSAEWLLRGEGEMLWEKPSLPLTSERESIYKELFERKERELAESRKRIEELIAHNAKLEQELTVFTMKKTDVQEAESASDAAIKLKPTGTDDL